MREKDAVSATATGGRIWEVKVVAATTVRITTAITGAIQIGRNAITVTVCFFLKGSKGDVNSKKKNRYT
jgi:hypothetical protein